MNTRQLKSSLLLLLTAVIWGTAFVAQSVGMDYIQPFTFTSIRFFISGLVLLPAIAVLDRALPERRALKQAQAALSPEARRAERRTLLLSGVCCGVCLCAATCLQQFGIALGADSGGDNKSGFITAFYIVIVPVLGLFFKRRCSPLVWVGVVLALGGLYLLCIKQGFSVSSGDLLVFLCSILFSVHIMVIDHFSGRVDGIKMSCVQFFTSGVFAALPMLLFERPVLSNILAGWIPLLYAAVLSGGVAYTLQILGQKGLNPAVASLILSLESVVSVVAYTLVLNQPLTGREVAGCVLMFIAIVLAQLPWKGKQKAKI